MRDHILSRALICVGVLSFAVPLASVTQAGAAFRDPGDGAVFVQTNDARGNGVAVFDRRDDGSLRWVATYATGGRGRRSAGSASDPLASQGSLVFDPDSSLLFAVNAGSDTISTFTVWGDVLRLQQVISSHGEFPTSIAVSHNLLYVLNAGGAANVSGFRIDGSRLQALGNGVRKLGLTETNPPQFLASPAQIGFTPDGRQLIVTGKTNNFIDVFAVRSDGRLAKAPVSTADASVPFAFAFSADRQLDLVNAAGSLAPSRVHGDGSITALSAPVGDGQSAACWIALSGDFAYVANTGSNDVSAYRIGHGSVSLLDAKAAADVTGATDETVDRGTLYVQEGLASAVAVFTIDGDGSLSLVQTQAVPGGGAQEGIASD